MNREDLAVELGCDPATITRWMRSGLPIRRRARPGGEHDFDPVACRAWLRVRRATKDHPARREDLEGFARLAMIEHDGPPSIVSGAEMLAALELPPTDAAPLAEFARWGCPIATRGDDDPETWRLPFRSASLWAVMLAGTLERHGLPTAPHDLPESLLGLRMLVAGEGGNP